ncbi:MAG: hypothetical protein M5Z89_09210, partial [Olivibacter sp.]|nr:hypothetical protein [Olivibacter sp. UJ_SKK_5.1]
FFLVFLCYFLFSVRKFDICKLNLKINKEMLAEMFSFSGWTLLGSLSVVSLSQGIAILVNMVSGVVANASLGLSEQVLLAINRLTGNFQTAFNPQIIKSYVSGNTAYLHNLLSQSSKLSFALVLLAVTPLFVDTEFILGLWLGQVPDYLASLVKVICIYILIDCLSGPFVTVIYAVGNLRQYQLVISAIMIANLLFAAILVYINVPLYLVVMSRVSCVLILLMYRFWVVGRIINFGIKEYLLKTILRLVIVGCASIFLTSQINTILEKSIIGLLLLVMISSFIVIVLFFIVAFTGSERKFCKDKVRLVWHKIF